MDPACAYKHRTKWKRQNQLRLDQLRQQSVEPQSETSAAAAEYGQHHKQQHQQHRLHSAEPHHGQQEHRVYVPSSAASTDSDMQAAAEASGTAPLTSSTAAVAAAAFIGAPYPGVANEARWNFLTTAAAIVRNVSYVHGCHM